jgi:hypothetical protein
MKVAKLGRGVGYDKKLTFVETVKKVRNGLVDGSGGL